MKKRTVAVLLALAMVLTCMLSACGGGDTSSASTPAQGGGDTQSTASAPSDDNQGEPAPASDGPMTDVGTPRRETLIVECQNSTDTPGQFNTYMQGTATGFGIQQMVRASLWEMNTITGEQFCDLAADFPESNADFTEHTFHVQTGIKWSDGEDFTAEDVAFTMNMIKDNPGIGASGFYQQTFESIEALDDTTVKIVTKNPFPRISLQFGVTIYGNDLRVVPKHIYENVEDPSQFKDETPVTCTPYVVSSYDELGNWILYERREDWEQTDVGLAGKIPQAKYVLFKYLGDDNTKQMLMVNNEVDIMCEVTPEMFDAMRSQNDKVSAWYDEWPYATSDDPCSKGIGFSQGAGEPFNNADFRWALALALDFEQISLNVFDGVGRASPFGVLTETKAMQDMYGEDLAKWAEEELRLDLGDGNGETYCPWDGEFPQRMAETMRSRGIDVPDDPEFIKDAFGVGWWKHDPEAAEKLLVKAGLEKGSDGKWMLNGQPFSFELSYLGDGSEAQQRRGAEAAYNQWLAFGLDVTLVSKSSSNWSTDLSTGAYQVASEWPTAGITKDMYSKFTGWHRDLISPMGEIANGSAARWDSQEATDILDAWSQTAPDSEESYEYCRQFVKLTVKDMVFIGFHSGVKMVPTNSTYWTNYPSATNDYNGPWWWWSVLKWYLPEITPAG